jgi:hypothetical protein
LGADEDVGRGTSLAAGKYISGDVCLEVTTDDCGLAAVQIEVALSKSLSILSRSGSFAAVLDHPPAQWLTRSGVMGGSCLRRDGPLIFRQDWRAQSSAS